MTAQDTRLTVVEEVEQSAIIRELDNRSRALAEWLPDEAAVVRFRRGIVLAIMRNPELLECTPTSMVLSVFEAAQMGLEPVREAHFVPRRINVGSRERPRYEKQAQMVPDYRGVIRLVTKTGSEVATMEARVVKEGDEFEYQLGSDAWVRHKPSLAADRSAHATTHVYSIARRREGGPALIDVEDRAGIERVKNRAHPSGFSPWGSDWDEMAKKTIVKRHSKVLPVPPDVRAILVREDELGELEAPDGRAQLPAGPTKASRLASRLKDGRGQEGDPGPAAQIRPETEPDAPAAASTPPPVALPAAPKTAAQGKPSLCLVDSPYGDGQACGLAKGHPEKLHRALDREGAIVGSWE